MTTWCETCWFQPTPTYDSVGDIPTTRPRSSVWFQPTPTYDSVGDPETSVEAWVLDVSTHAHL